MNQKFKKMPRKIDVSYEPSYLEINTEPVGWRQKLATWLRELSMRLDGKQTMTVEFTGYQLPTKEAYRCFTVGLMKAQSLINEQSRLEQIDKKVEKMHAGEPTFE
jgi:hypothetical protein